MLCIKINVQHKSYQVENIFSIIPFQQLFVPYCKYCQSNLNIKTATSNLKNEIRMTELSRDISLSTLQIRHNIKV